MFTIPDTIGNSVQTDVVDDVKNESIKNTFPAASSRSERHDELRLNFTRADFYIFVEHVWNDVYWLANLVIWMEFTGTMLNHHFDLRLQMAGARMRIACCSLMYRKVNLIRIPILSIRN